VTNHRRRFRSGRLPLEHFETRFSDENVRFWVPIFVEEAGIASGDRVLDVGCGTGGYSVAIAAATGAKVTGLDESDRFVARAREVHGPVEFVVGDAERLPFPDGSFDRVLFSLVLHQAADPEAAVREGARVLVPGGRVFVRTIAPEDVASRIPERYLPAMAAADEARVIPIAALVRMLEGAGFGHVSTRHVLRNANITVDEVERAMDAERARYDFLTDAGVDEARRRLRGDGGPWVDPRSNTILVATRC
jgi:ubiquinone/menaquinone biosynthesis C-methylase UbiE